MISFSREINCDVCKKHIASEKITKDKIQNKDVPTITKLLFSTSFDKSMSVVFTTNQTDGYPAKPHLSHEVITICDECLEKIFNGLQLFGYGAQGHNRYYFKEPTEVLKYND